jgi:[ribosomal protein S18]-alanine N-acetyltransferase
MEIAPITKELHPGLVKIALQDIGSMYESAIHDELEEVTSGRSFGVCALENGTPIGYAVAKKTVDTYHLLNGIFAEIEQQGGKILNVVTDADANESLRFYLRNGFALAGIVQDEFISGVAQAHLTRRIGYKP